MRCRLTSVARSLSMQARSFRCTAVLGSQSDKPVAARLGKQKRPRAFTESALLAVMGIRDRLLTPVEATARPDYSAKEETMKMAMEGKEHPAVLAYKNGSLGLGFSAGGLLFPYYIGVVAALHDLGIITPSTKIAGASAGSLIAACYNAGMTTDEILDACLELSADLRENGTYQRLGLTLRKFLEEHLPADAHERCSGVSHVAVTRAFPYAQGELISSFESRADLVDCLLTSCRIPLYFDGALARRFRGKLSYDGGVTNFLPSPPVDYTARVCCFPSQRVSIVSNIHIAPDSFDEGWEGVSVSQLFAWALAPAEETVLRRLSDKGRQDAAAWANLTGVLDAACPDQDDWYRHKFMNADVISPAMVSVDLLQSEDEVDLPKGAPAVVSSLVAAKGLQADDGNAEDQEEPEKPAQDAKQR